MQAQCAPPRAKRSGGGRGEAAVVNVQFRKYRLFPTLTPNGERFISSIGVFTSIRLRPDAPAKHFRISAAGRARAYKCACARVHSSIQFMTLAFKLAHLNESSPVRITRSSPLMRYSIYRWHAEIGISVGTSGIGIQLYSSVMAKSAWE